MANILKVTTPTTGYENTPRTNPINVNDTRIPNIVDPSKVSRADGRDTTQEKDVLFNFDSNFENFATSLRNTKGITEEFSQILFQLRTEVSAGISGSFAEEISNFMNMINFSDADLLAFLKDMVSQNAKFSGGFFDGIRNLMESTNSVDLKKEMLMFLKVFNDVDSSASTLNNMRSILFNIMDYLPTEYKGNLFQMVDMLQKGKNGLGQNPENTLVLKKQIVPFLASFIKQTNNLGRARDLVTMLTLNIAKYENGDLLKLEDIFYKLTDFKDFKKEFGNISFDSIKEMLVNKNENPAMNQFVNIMEKALNGGGGYETKLAFQNVLNAMLINQSVYMPLLHLMVPAQLNGRMMFSELWVDPNSGNNSGGGEGGSAKKLLIKFDVQEVGYFDLIIVENQGKIDMQLLCPEAVSDKDKDIKKDISDIIEKNGLNLKSLAVGVSKRPVTISEVFPQIYERKNAINVKI